MSKVSDGGDRIAGRAEHRACRRVGHRAQHHRVPGPHRDAVHRERADLGHDGGGVVVAARRSSRRSRSRGPTSRRPSRTAAAISSGHVRHDLEAVRLAADRLRLRREHHASSCRAARPRRARRRPGGSRRRSGSRSRPAAGARPAPWLPRRPRRPRPPVAAGGPRAAAARRRSRPRRSSGRAGRARRPRAARPRRRPSCTSSRMTTASKSPGIGSPVSTTSKAPAARRTGLVSLAPTVSAARTAMPSIAAASNGGEEVCAQTGSAVTRPTASSSRHSHGLEPLRAPGGRAGLLPGGERLGGGTVVDERGGAGHYRYSMTSTSLPAARPVAASGTTT